MRLVKKHETWETVIDSFPIQGLRIAQLNGTSNAEAHVICKSGYRRRPENRAAQTGFYIPLDIYRCRAPCVEF